MAGLSEAISWYGTQMLLIATALGMLGSVLALRIASPSGAPRLRAALPRLVLASQVLVVTGWVAFLGCLEAAHPGLDPHVPPDTLLEAWAAASVTALLAMLIAVRGARNLRNAALAGSLLSSGVSCMAFIGMSGLVAPAVVAYHLGGILLGMGGGSVLAGLACWLLRAPHERAARRLAGPLIAAAMVLIVMVSFASILSFSDWSVEVDTPGAIAFRPIVVVSVSELVVTTLLGALGATIDHRAARLTSRENDRLRELTESTFEALAIHRDGFVLDANAAFCRMIGRPAAEVKGERLVRFLPGQLVLPLPAHARDRVREVDIVSAQGETLPVEVLSRDITYGGERASVLALRDITERRRAEDQIRFLAHHDALTGLPNRAHVQDMMVRQLALSQRSGEPMAVLCLDLDRFKAVNDTFGHQAGDRLLQLVAERLLANIRTSDAAARIGGDEFVLLLSRVGRADSVAQLARRLIEKLSEPFDLGGFEARIGASIGIAVGPHDGTTAEALVKNADVALYRAKASGRGGYCFFEAGMDRLARERRVLEQALRQAVAGCQFDLVYQPQFTTVGTRVVALEALVRWQHPERGAVSPVEFIPLAESTGLIVPLGHWVMQTACRAAVGWSMPCRVAVNVSPRQFVGGEFAAVVTTVLQETGLPPDRLELEVTESLMMHDADAALACLQQLKAMGVHVALDDFGTGFSSLSYLQRFPFDKVKIDRSFITDLIASDSARAIVGAIVAMAHHLRLAVTAEGVETVEQLAMLRRQNCDMVQGFLLSRPLPADQVPAFLEGQRARPEEVTLEVVTP